MAEYQVEIYQDRRERQPFADWVNALRDRRAQAAVDSRLRRIALGNLGDYKSVGEGVRELRLDIGPGYRVYFGRVGNTIILLLCGGDKSTQRKDIEKAKAYWADYKERP